MTIHRRQASPPKVPKVTLGALKPGQSFIFSSDTLDEALHTGAVYFVVNAPEAPAGTVEFVNLSDGGKFRRDRSHVVTIITTELHIDDIDLAKLEASKALGTAFKSNPRMGHYLDQLTGDNPSTLFGGAAIPPISFAAEAQLNVEPILCASEILQKLKADIESTEPDGIL